jgi:hypothetical protein
MCSWEYCKEVENSVKGIKLFLCLTKHQVIETYRILDYSSTILDHGNRNDFSPSRLGRFTSGEGFLSAADRAVTLNRFDDLEMRRTLPLPGIEVHPLGRPSAQAVTMSTELSRLPENSVKVKEIAIVKGN